MEGKIMGISEVGLLVENITLSKNRTVQAIIPR